MGYINLKLSPNDPLIICFKDENGDVIMDPRRIPVVYPLRPIQLALDNNNDMKYLRYKALCREIEECGRKKRGPLMILKDIVDEKIGRLEESL